MARKPRPDPKQAPKRGPKLDPEKKALVADHLQYWREIEAKRHT